MNVPCPVLACLETRSPLAVLFLLQPSQVAVVFPPEPRTAVGDGVVPSTRSLPSSPFFPGARGLSQPLHLPLTSSATGLLKTLVSAPSPSESPPCQVSRTPLFLLTMLPTSSQPPLLGARLPPPSARASLLRCLLLRPPGTSVPPRLPALIASSWPGGPSSPDSAHSCGIVPSLNVPPLYSPALTPSADSRLS